MRLLSRNSYLYASRRLNTIFSLSTIPFPSNSSVASEVKVLPIRKIYSIGQPSHKTHPHLLSKDEVSVGLSISEFELRRSKLMSELDSNSVVIVMGNRLKYRSNNIFYPFHQNPNLLYLTGFDQPDSALLLTKDEGAPRGYRMTLFVPPKDPAVELWEGAKCGLENAVEYFKADYAHDIKEFSKMIKPILNQAPAIYLDVPKNIEVNSLEHALTSHIFQHKLSPKVKYLKKILDELRLIKSESEIALLKRAGDIASYGFIQAMEQSDKKDLGEHDIATTFETACRRLGSQGNAYVPVVAGGTNALTLHYVANDQKLRAGDLIMMDAGAAYFGYGSDITRTWPVTGKFSQSQKELYQAVLNVQKQCIKMCTEEANCSLNDILFHSVDSLHKELLLLGFSLSKNEVHSQLYPHHVGHYLGLDVHDTPTAARTQKLKKNMVVTIEPGVYIPNKPEYPPRFRGIGIRIEDDVLVTEKGDPIILSATAPKEISDLEFVCSGSRVNK